MNSRYLCFPVLTATLLVGAPAAAQDPFPGLIRNHLGASSAPPCSLCHAKGNTGSGTVVTPFGWAMRGRGLEADNPDSVATALDALKASNADSDGDGVGDVAELIAGTDPNSAGPVPLPNGEQAGYGCGGTAPDPNRKEGALPPLAIVALFALRRLSRTTGKDRASR